MFLHSFEPIAAALSLGPLTIYWYGIIMALAIAAAIFVAAKTAPRYNINSETVIDVSFWLIIGGLIGARAYEIFLEFPFYVSHPQQIIQIWNGGLAIHGALIGGAVALIVFAKKHRLDLWKLMAVAIPAVAVGQAIGRWGNWFNQELFGRPTDSLIGIPIAPFNRPAGYETFQYFHPTFVYESIGCLIIFFILYLLVRRTVAARIIIAAYCIGYGALRFSLEFIKIDSAPIVIGLRWPQIASLLLILIGISLLALKKRSEPITKPS